MISGTFTPQPMVEVFDGRDALGLALRLGCDNKLVDCEHRVLMASPTTGFVTTMAGDSWQEVFLLESIGLTADGETVISRRLTASSGGDAGRVATETRTFTPFAASASAMSMAENFAVGGRVALMELTEGAIYEPVVGEEPRLVGTADFFGEGQVIEGTTELIVIRARIGDGFTLKTFTPGQASLEDLTSDAGPAGPWSLLFRSLRTPDTLYYYGRRVDNAAWEMIVITADATRVWPALGQPFLPVVTEAGLLYQARHDSDQTALVLVNATETRLLLDEATSSFRVEGGDPWFVHYGGDSDTPMSLWEITPDGNTTLIGRDLENAQLAWKEGVAGVLYTVPDSEPLGASRYYRRHTTNGLEVGLWAANVSSTFPSHVARFLIAHDGSLLSYDYTHGLLALPPAALMPIVLGTDTPTPDCFRTPSATLCSSALSAFAYHDGAIQELAGPETIRPMAQGARETNFIKYDDGGWRIARVVVAGDQTVSLETIYSPAVEPESNGLDPRGRMVVRTAHAPGEIILLDDAEGAFPLARGAGLEPAYAIGQLGGVVVAAMGRDALGSYLVSTEDPTSCWSVPAGFGVYATTGADAEELFAVERIEDFTWVLWEPVAGRLSVLRPRGHPDRPPPTW